MIKLRHGNVVHQLLLLLSVSGEFPAQSLGILGNAKMIKRTVHRLESIQDFSLYSDDSIIRLKLFLVSGKRDKRTIRLFKGSLSVLSEIHPDALSCYLDSFPSRFSGNDAHVYRNHRVAEALAMCFRAGIEIRPYVLPKLQKKDILSLIPELTGYYTARYLKKLDVTELNKTIFTRMVGAVFYPGGVYSVYNTRDAVMKWSGMGELKARQDLTEIARMNAGLDEVNSAILFGRDISVALKTLIESDKTKKMELRFDKIYNNIYFLPMNNDGIELLKILVLPDWNAKLLNILLPPEMRKTGYGFMEYDGFFEGKYIFSFINSNIARLVRLKEALKFQKENFEILCLSWQVKFLKGFLDETVSYRVYEIDAIKKALGVK